MEGEKSSQSRPSRKMNRTFEMIYLLMQKKCMTASELASHFEVSTRTIFRDLDELSAAGIPVYATKGRGGGVRLMDNFVLDKSLLSEVEQDEILFALQSFRATNAGDGKQIAERLAGLFQKSNIDWIYIDFTHWGSASYEKDKFTKLKQAILGRKLVEFLYYNALGESSKRLVEPVKLVFKGGSWYLQAFCLEKMSYRTFKMLRMDDILVTNTEFNQRDELPPELPKDWDESKQERYVLLFTKQVAYRVYDDFWRSQIQPQEDGSLMVTVDYPSGGWLEGFLLSYGADVTVLSPKKEREKLRQLALKIVEKY